MAALPLMLRIREVGPAPHAPLEVAPRNDDLVHLGAVLAIVDPFFARLPDNLNAHAAAHFMHTVQLASLAISPTRHTIQSISNLAPLLQGLVGLART